MTEIRTRGKGKDRIVYPIKKRQSFGISKELAYGEVQALRNQGKRARLIKTNRKLDLYAPYIADLRDGPGAPQADEIRTDQPGKDSNRNINNGDRVNISTDLGILNPGGEINLNNEDLRQFFGKDSTMNIAVNDRTLALTSVNAEHISMLRETMDTDLPNGYLVPVGYGKEFSTEWTNSARGNSSKWPKLDYEKDSWTVRLEGKNLEAFLEILKSDSGKVQFTMNGDSKNASVEIRSGGIHDKIDRHTPGTGITTVTSNRILKEENTPSGWDVSVKAAYATEYLRPLIRTMMGRSEFRHPGDSVLIMKMKQDYPLEAETRRITGGKRVTVQGLIAPRMD
jgi:hypothetical protein